MSPLLVAAFFVSGASALVFEGLWFRQAGLAFGNSLWASTLVLTGFMAGTAIGNALAGRYGDRLRAPLKAYAVAELTIACAGVALVYALPGLGVALAPMLRSVLDSPWILNSIRLLVALVLLLAPSTAMGLTLPLLTRAARATNTTFGATLGTLYGWNTLGAVVGVVVGEVWLVSAFGVRGAALVAGGLNVAVALVAFWLSATRGVSAAPVETDVPEITIAGRAREYRRWLIAAFGAGFALLALEVIWFRLVLLVVMGHATAFALMLATVLSGIGLGGLAGGIWLRRQDGDAASATLAFLSAIGCVATYAGFPAVLEPFSTRQVQAAGDILRIGIPLMLPVSILSGVLFATLGASVRRRHRSDAGAAGALSLANTKGAALGSAVGGFVLLPVLGAERALFSIAVLYAAIGVLLLTAPGLRRTVPALCTAAAVAGLALFPWGLSQDSLWTLPLKRYATLRRGPSTDLDTMVRLLKAREGSIETVMYLDVAMGGRPLFQALFTNSVPMADTEYYSRRYMKLFVYWPMAVHAHARSALLIAFGVGNTAKALTDSASLEHIDVVDISRDVLDASTLVFPNRTEHPLSDPRVRVHVEDGRYFLQTTDQRYDLITSEPPPPVASGTVNLYTREYFHLLHDRLNPGGIVSYWLPIHAVSDRSTRAVIRAFCDVFEDCSLWNGFGSELMLVGTNAAAGPVPEEHFTAQWRTPTISKEMARLGLERPEQLGALFIGDAPFLKALTRDSAPLTDDNPKLIEAAAGPDDERQSLAESFTNIAACRDRFATSSWVAQLWPPGLITASLPYFHVQDLINAHGYGRPVHLKEVYDLATAFPLKTPVLWMLGSDSDVQRLVEEVPAPELARPEMQFHLGVRLVSEGSYAAAAIRFEHAEQQPQRRDVAFALRLYSLCLAKRPLIAWATARERANGKDPASIWTWLPSVCGLDDGAAASPTKLPL